VHRAWLADGTAVAVKVQYPGVAEALRADLDNAALLAKVLGGAGRAMADLDPKPYYDEIRAVVGAELDYRREAELNARYAEAAAPFPELHVPRVFASHSSARVLTLEFAEGVSLQTFANSEASQAERWRVGRQLAYAVMGPFLRRDLVHADPHPGNFLVRPDGRLTVLDFGALKQLSPRFVRAFWSLIESACADQEPDFLSVIERGGFVIQGDREVARKAMAGIHNISAKPVLVEEYDWGSGTVVAELRNHFRENVREVTRILPPVESIFFYRALGGLAQNLKLVRARGPYRALCRELGQHLEGR
jgi:predicted unusual protein kinase regulating ubiquinone biosynthesis (AarF/ABC1/UbiB family)